MAEPDTNRNAKERSQPLATVVESRPPGQRRTTLGDFLFGRRLASSEEEEQKIGPLAGIPVLGLDALSSAAYGPEAALTFLLPLGALGLSYVVPISALLILVLLIWRTKRAGSTVDHRGW